jgi:hypothetical protein
MSEGIIEGIGYNSRGSFQEPFRKITILKGFVFFVPLGQAMELERYLVPERKARSGTILDFGLKKENNFSALIISEVTSQKVRVTSLDSRFRGDPVIIRNI